MDLCLWMKEQLSKEDFESFAMHTWAVWRTRQNYIHSDKRVSMTTDIGWSATFVHDFCKARKPPSSSSLKLNINAKVNEDTHLYIIGGIVRDKQGRLLLAFGKQINEPISVVHGELLAIRECVNLLYEKNLKDVQVATDSILAVQAVTTNQDNLSYIGLCAEEISSLLKIPVISDIIHVRRSANKVTHHLANFASYFPSSFVLGE